MKKILFVMLCLLLPLSVNAYSSTDNSHYITQDKYVEENKSEEKDFRGGLLFILSMTITGIVLSIKRNKIVDLVLLLLNLLIYMNDLTLLFLLLGSISFLTSFLATAYVNKELQKFRVKEETLPKLADEKFKLVTQTNFEGRRISSLSGGGSSSDISSDFGSSSSFGGGSYSCVRYSGGGGHSSGGGSTRGF